MASRDHALLLLPVLGLCSCVTSSEGPGATLVPTDPELPAATFIATEPTRQPMSVTQAALRSAHQSLEAGDYAAAHESFTLAALYEPTLEPQMSLGRLDALIGLGDDEVARQFLASIDSSGDESIEAEKAIRDILLRERRHVAGTGACELSVVPEPQQLKRRPGAWTAWNDLRGGLAPSEHTEIPLDGDDWEAERSMCGHRDRKSVV